MSKIIRFDQSSAAVSDYHCRELDSGVKAPAETARIMVPVRPAAVRSKDGRTPDEILENALEKARDLVSSAEDFHNRKIRETRETIDRESQKEKQTGYADGRTQGLEDGRREGRKAGYRDGLEQGRGEAKEINRKNLDELSRMIACVEQSKTKILEQFEDELEDLATSMAKSILKRELATDDKTMRAIILAAMEKYRKQEWIRIYTSDRTAGVLMEADGNIAKALADISDNVKVISTPGMDESDCVIETPDQIIDAGLGSQLKKVRHGIDEIVKAGRKNSGGQPTD